MLVFNAEEEVPPPMAPNLLPKNVMAMFNEWDLFPDLVKQNMSFIQYLNRKRETERQQQDKRPRAPNKVLKNVMNKLSLPTFDGGNKTFARA